MTGFAQPSRNGVVSLDMFPIDLGDLPPVLTPKQLGKLIDKSRDALACDRYFGRGIPYTKIGARVYYLKADVAEYLAAYRQETKQQ